MSTNTSKDKSKTLARIEDAASGMRDSAEALTASGKGSVFEKVETKDESGATKMEYDTEAIYEAVSAFVKDYNELLSTRRRSRIQGVFCALREIWSITRR